MKNRITANVQSFTDLDVLKEIGSIGSGHATIALSAMLHEKVDVEMHRLHITPPHLVPKIYEEHDTVVAAVFMQLRNKLDCDLMLIFEAEEAKKIGALMAKDAAENEANDEMASSAIEEIGSIMICSFLNAMANFTGIELVPNPPQLIYDAFDAVIDELLAKQALCSNIAVVFDTRFKRMASSAEGYLIMFPGEKIRKELAEKGKEWLKANIHKKNIPILSTQ